MLVRAATPEERSAIASTLGAHLSPEARGLVAVDKAGAVRGGVLYDGWMANSVQCHMAVSTPIAWRHLLPVAFRYPFVDGGRGVLIGVVRAGNVASGKMCRHLGFREAHRVRDGAEAGEDLIIFEMRREECRYLGSRKAE